MATNSAAAASPKSIGLTSDSFVSARERASVARVRRAIVNVEGEQKTGKTDVCIRTAPGPIVIFNFDQGLEGVVEKFMKKKEIIIAGMKDKTGKSKYPSYHFARPVPVGGRGHKDQLYLDSVKKLAVPIWEKFISDYNEFLNSSARTGIIDTGGACFQLAKFAFIGMDKATSKDDPYGQKGGEMKSIFQGLITDGYNYDKNVFWIHRIKENWSGGQPDGTYRADGYAQIAYEVQFTLRVKKMKKGKETVRLAEIRDCRLGRGNENDGMKFGGAGDPPIDFPTIMTELVPGSEYEEWE